MNTLDNLETKAVAKGWRRSSVFIMLTIAILIAWANFAELEEVAVAGGEVVPQGQIKVIQHLEGGIISEIYVTEGDTVSANDLLIQLDLGITGSNREEVQIELDSLILARARLTAETQDIDLIFPKDVSNRRPELVQAELHTYDGHKLELESAMSVLREQTSQRKLDLKQAISKLNTLNKESKTRMERFVIAEEVLAEGLVSKIEFMEIKIAQLDSLKKESATKLERFLIAEELLAEGLASKIEFLEIKQEVEHLQGEVEELKSTISRAKATVAESEARLREEKLRVKQEQEHLEGQIEDLQSTISRAKAGIMESEARLSEETLRVKRVALEELSGVERRIAAAREKLSRATDQFVRTKISSPINGVVQSMRHHTIGGVVRAGESLMEIVPTQERLVVEAKLNPTDIGYVKIGQASTVKISTYDFSRYGGLQGHVVSISPDSHIDASTGESYFKVVAETDKNYLGDVPGELPIAPGMEATLDIHTGSKTVIQYLLKPVIKVKSEAFRER